MEKGVIHHKHPCEKPVLFVRREVKKQREKGSGQHRAVTVTE